jgi:hypothetical protein
MTRIVWRPYLERGSYQMFLNRFLDVQNYDASRMFPTEMSAFVVAIFFCLWISSIWLLVQSSSLYWKTLSISLLAACSTTAYVLSVPLSNLELVITTPLLLALVLFSLFLTPLQLVFSRPKNRQRFSTAEVLYDPITATSEADEQHVLAE